MGCIDFVKSTSNGNTFILINGDTEKELDDKALSSLALGILNPHFGVGADGLIVFQKCTMSHLEDLKKNGNVHWQTSPSWDDADYTFRIFEPNGEESLSCGNGLICLADYLYNTLNINYTTFLTEIPAAAPRIISAGKLSEKDDAWVDLGNPRKIPDMYVDRTAVVSVDGAIDGIDGLVVPCHGKEKAFTGYITYTGEPHLVFFAEDNFDDKDIDLLFGYHDLADRTYIDPWSDKSNYFVHQMGKFIQTHYRDLFPKGINVNITRVVNNIIDNRCFERGIARETLSCGTGAVASAYVSFALKRITEDNIIVQPKKCWVHNQNLHYRIKRYHGVWIIFGKPDQVCTGTYAFP